ncbi:MAG TPA: hypothetical protein VFY54_14090, partial [Rubrobacter sp.]|nr:hypothetical protein [Rubrobacter sp.]
MQIARAFNVEPSITSPFVVRAEVDIGHSPSAPRLGGYDSVPDKAVTRISEMAYFRKLSGRTFENALHPTLGVSEKT